MLQRERSGRSPAVTILAQLARAVVRLYCWCEARAPEWLPVTPRWVDDAAAAAHGWAERVAPTAAELERERVFQEALEAAARNPGHWLNHG